MFFFYFNKMKKKYHTSGQLVSYQKQKLFTPKLNKNTTQYVLDTTRRIQTQITLIRHAPWR
jgi:hypothetical protein